MTDSNDSCITYIITSRLLFLAAMIRTASVKTKIKCACDVPFGKLLVSSSYYFQCVLRRAVTFEDSSVYPLNIVRTVEQGRNHGLNVGGVRS